LVRGSAACESLQSQLTGKRECVYHDGATVLGECFEVRHGFCVPYADSFILASCRKEFTVAGDCEGEDVVEVAGEILFVS
jgi:hypothetical protein